jgi:hypothetical protein
VRTIRAFLAGIVFILFATLFHVTSTSASDSIPRFFSRFGMGYESVSQGFYTLTADTADALTIATLETSTLDDLRTQGTIGFTWRGLILETGLDYTPELWRYRLRSDYRVRNRILSLRAQGNLDRRKRHDGDLRAGDEHLVGNLRTRTEVRLSEMSDLWLSTSLESVEFDSTSGSVQSSRTLGGRLGYTHHFGFLSSLSISPFLQSRNVPDSSDLIYQSSGLESNLLVLQERLDFDAILRLENRKYDRVGEFGDFTLFDGSLRHRLRLGGSMLQTSRTESELYLYRESDSLNLDFWQVQTRQLIGAAVGRFEFLIGPYIGWLAQSPDTSAYREDYFEYGTAVSADMVGDFRGTAGLEMTLAYRKLRYPSEYQTDFLVLRGNFIGDYRIIGNLSASLFLTSEWEWHKESSDNSRISLLSGGFEYRF